MTRLDASVDRKCRDAREPFDTTAPLHSFRTVPQVRLVNVQKHLYRDDY